MRFKEREKQEVFPAAPMGETHASNGRPWMVAPGLRAAGIAQRNGFTAVRKTHADQSVVGHSVVCAWKTVIHVSRGAGYLVPAQLERLSYISQGWVGVACAVPSPKVGIYMSGAYSEEVIPHPSSGTEDDDDDRDDEHEGENEAPIREVSDQTEAPEEFEVDDEDDLGHPEDDDLDDEKDEE
jgi:hypothetical protein